MLFSVTAVGQQLRLDPFPTGLAPLGIDVTASSPQAGGPVYAVVANSGDNSVSIFALNYTGPAPVTPLTVVRGIPSPYAVAACGSPEAPVLVTFPSDNSVRVIQVPGGKILGTVQVGSQPYAVSCWQSATGMKGSVSNVGDNSVTVFDVATLAITATIPGVPGSRGFHGIDAGGWVAGTDANVLTILDLINLKVLIQIPVSRPTAVRDTFVASAGSNAITQYDPTTLQVLSTIQNVPNPQDLVIPPCGDGAGLGLGYLATIGGQDALWRLELTPSSNAMTTSVISGVPGAAALAATTFGFISSPSSCVALVTSTNSNSVFLVHADGGPPAQFRAQGAAAAFQSLPPGSLASAFATTGLSQNFSATTLPLPTTLGGATLSLGGTLNFSATSGWTYSSTGAVQAPLLFVGPNQINFQIPPGFTPGSAVPAQLTEPNGTTLLTTLNITATAPGIFSVLQNGQGQGAVLNQDNSQNGNPQSIVGANPAARGSVIQIFATGAEATIPMLMPGEPAPASGNPLVLTNVQPTVTIGGQTAQVQFSGMAPGFVGLWQINAVVPQSVTPGLAVPLVISAGGATSNTVTIAVQ